MGTLTSEMNMVGYSVGDGVILGWPIEKDGLYQWEDTSLPDGVLLSDGTIERLENDEIIEGVTSFEGVTGLNEPVVDLEPQ